MKPPPFAYHDPATVEEALALLADLDDAKVIAGGQSLMPMMNMRLAATEHLVDINGVAGLAGIGFDDGHLLVGATTRQRACEQAPQVRASCPLMAEALPHIGHVATRNRGTVGGSLAHVDPAAELLAVATAVDGSLDVRSARGRRRISIHDFPVTFFTSALEPDELIVSVRLPLWPEGHGYAFEEFARRHGDFAVVAAAALVNLDTAGRVDRAAVALVGMGGTPVRAREVEDMLLGEAPSPDLLRSARQRATAYDALEDIHGSADYRRHLAGVLTERALRRATSRAEGVR